MKRRALLRVAAAGGTIGLGGLAGCIGESDDGGGGGGADGDGGQQAQSDGDTPTDDGSDDGDDTEEGTDDEGTDDGGTAEETIRVGPGGDLVFDPAEASVDVGTTVEWVWDSDTHTVTPESIPDGSDWEGTGSTTHDAGYSHSHTFETEGQYDYYCEPHRSAGMVGTLLVGDVSSDGGTDDDGMDDDETETPTPTADGDDDGGSGDDGDDDGGYDY